VAQRVAIREQKVAEMRLLISSDLFCLLPGVRHLLPATWFLKDWFPSCWWFLADVTVPPLEIESPLAHEFLFNRFQQVGCACSLRPPQLAAQLLVGQERRFRLTPWGPGSPDRLVFCRQTNALESSDETQGEDETAASSQRRGYRRESAERLQAALRPG